MKPIKVTTRELTLAQERRWNVNQSLRGHINSFGDDPKDPNVILVRRKLHDRAAIVNTEFASIRDRLAGDVEAALQAVNGKAEAHVISRYDTVLWIANRAETDVLEARGVAIKRRVGCRVSYIPNGPGRAYGRKSRGQIISTFIELKRVTDGWRMTDVARQGIWPDAPESLRVTVSEEAAEDIRSAAFEDIRIA